MAKLDLSKFVRDMQKALKTERPRLEETVRVKDFDQEVVLQSLTEAETNAAVAYSTVPLEQNKYMVYHGSPTIRALAEKLIELESIEEPMGVLNGFKPADIDVLAGRIAGLSVEYQKPTIEEVKTVKKP